MFGPGMELGIAGECDGALVIDIDASLLRRVLNVREDRFRGVGGIFGGGLGDIVQDCVSGNTLQFSEES